MPDFYEVVRGRQSVRAYRPDAVSEEVLWRLLEAANQAPSAHNGQPWHFYVLCNALDKRRLMEAAGGTFAADLRKGGMGAEEAETQAAASVAHFSEAPVLMAAFATDAAGKAPAEIERVLRIQSVAAAIAQLLLAAQAEGLGACWYSLALYCPEALREALGAPPSWSPQALITLGHARQDNPRREKRPVKEKVTFY